MRSEQSKANQKVYLKKYFKEHYTFLTIRLKNGKDDELLNYLKALPNQSEFIRKTLYEAVRKAED